jgi:IS5 family transposase
MADRHKTIAPVARHDIDVGNIPLYDSASMRRFAGIYLGHEPVPDETTIWFRHLLKQNDLCGRVFERVNGHLAERGVQPAIVDATIIATPSSPKIAAAA